MKKIIIILLSVCHQAVMLTGQTNIHFTNPVIYDVLKGNYNPQDYLPAFPVDDPNFISQQLIHQIRPDSLKATLIALQAFHNRNTGSDTLSDSIGMGAARKWVLRQFERFSAQQQSRLLTGYLEFDQDICGMDRHKNVVAVLPGRDTADPSSIIIEAHLDSRCQDKCSGDCLALGIDDNGSGVALVIELARVMSQFTFDHTLIFMTTTGEEQGLYGANAFAVYAKTENIPIKAVLNNDIVGGIICGMTSSPPSCPGYNDIDSTQVRLFSYGGFNSPHKQLSRFIKLEYNEMIKPLSAVPMQISIMSPEDRTGRGGDHIPFRENGFTAMRFCSANENGDANVKDINYHDRQHTSDDILGVDTNGDMLIDSFFVDFDYLSRNATINGNAAAMAALGPRSPGIEKVSQDGDWLYVDLHDAFDYNNYVVALRVNTNDFDTLYYTTHTKVNAFRLAHRDLNIFVSAASIDDKGIESLFSDESLVKLTTGTSEILPHKNVELFQNKPNPFDDSTIISFWVQDPVSIQSAKITITGVDGKLVSELPVKVHEGMNEVLYDHGYNMSGTYLYSLYINGQLVDTKKMVFAN